MKERHGKRKFITKDTFKPDKWKIIFTIILELLYLLVLYPFGIGESLLYLTGIEDLLYSIGIEVSFISSIIFSAIISYLISSIVLDYSDKRYSMKSKLNRMFEKTISRRLYLFIFSFHLLIVGIVIMLVGSLSSYFFLILFFSIIRPVLILFHNTIGNLISLPEFWIFEKSQDTYLYFLPWTPIIYFLIGLIWLQFKKDEKITIEYLLISMIVTWLIFLSLSFIFFRSQWGE